MYNFVLEVYIGSYDTYFTDIDRLYPKGDLGVQNSNI